MYSTIKKLGDYIYNKIKIMLVLKFPIPIIIR